MANTLKVSNPKLGRRRIGGQLGWFKYYAGYSAEFVADIIKAYSKEGDWVLDPWSGSGTTLNVCKAMGRNSIGCDINPALLVVAKAKVMDVDQKNKIVPCLERIMSCFHFNQKGIKVSKRDPLCLWLRFGTARNFRLLERSIAREFSIDNEVEVFGKVSAASTLACFFYVAIFRLLRNVIKPFYSSNPTWIKVASDSSDRISIKQEDVAEGFKEEVFKMLDSWGVIEGGGGEVISQVSYMDSKNLNLESDSMDLVITSPPYCTRIDYVRAMLSELALLGMDDPLGNDFLKSNTIGSTTNYEKYSYSGCDLSYRFGPECAQVLESIRSHPSKASSTYYYKYFFNYFSDMKASLEEISRILKPGGVAAIVVQDSYYKDIHIDLPFILTSETMFPNMKCVDVYGFVDNQSYSLIHQYSKNYRADKSVTESVIVMEKKR